MNKLAGISQPALQKATFEYLAVLHLEIVHVCMMHGWLITLGTRSHHPLLLLQLPLLQHTGSFPNFPK